MSSFASWEYCYCTAEHGKAIAVMNEKGVDGWEVAGLLSQQGMYVIYFKRAKCQESSELQALQEQGRVQLRVSSVSTMDLDSLSLQTQLNKCSK